MIEIDELNSRSPSAIRTRDLTVELNALRYTQNPVVTVLCTRAKVFERLQVNTCKVFLGSLNKQKKL